MLAARRPPWPLRLPPSVALLVLALVPGAGPGHGEPPSEERWVGYEPVRGLMTGSDRERRRAGRQIEGADDPRFAAPLVDALFFVRREDRQPLVATLQRLTGAELGADYYEWVEWVGARADLELPPGYLGWKSSLLSRIDSRYERILRPGIPLRIRPEEIVWGGVRVEGIPALDQPPIVPAGDSELAPGDHVFGVEVAGAARAYPVKVLSWHEMVNDLVGGRAVTLSFCTLCGSAVLFDGETGERPRSFGTSGLLYRSNKLMIDRETFSLWSNLTGEAVAGPEAAGPATLTLLPVVRTRWDEWLGKHPETTVLDVAALARRYRLDYRPGAADEARSGVSFPVWQTSDALPDRSEVFVLRLGSRSKVYPLDLLPPESLIQDRLGDVAVLLLTDAGGGVRAYRRDDRRFERTDAGLLDPDGCVWTVTEPALEPCATAADAEPLPRIPGHLAFWFGWYGTVPEAEVYDGSGSPP